MLIYLLLLACSGDDDAPPSEIADADTDADTDADADADADADTDTHTDTAVGSTGSTGDTAPGIVGTAPLLFRGKRPKNILMVSIDTFRKDHLTRYGGTGETDWLDAQIEEGVVMDDHLTCSNWTFPGTSCTLLGRYHEDNDHIPQLSTANRAPFPDGEPFVATILRDAGYDTAISSRNGWLSAEWNNVQGYDAVLPGLFGTSAQLDRGYDHLLETGGPVEKGQPWFLHVHVTEPHVPYAPPANYLAELEKLDPIDYDLTVSSQHYEARDAWSSMPEDEQALVLEHMQVRYRGGIAWLDDMLADEFERFDDAGLLDDTLVVFWNDHGEQFWEHGHLTHAYDLYREENDGYLWFWSKNIEPGAYTGPTSAVDVVPTLLDAVQVPDPEWRNGEVIGTADPDRPRFALSVARLGVVASVTRGDDRMIFYGRFGRQERYDLAADPLEQNDLFGQDAALDGELWDLVRPQVEKAQAIAPHLVVVWPE